MWWQIKNKIKLTALLCLWSFTLISLKPAQLLAGPVEANSVMPTVEIDQPVVLVGEKRSIYVLVDFDVAEIHLTPDKARTQPEPCCRWPPADNMSP